jgi:putative ABC transport system substrate-binding protein
MRRRKFIELIGGAAVAWPIAARAQQPAKTPHVVFISPAALSDTYRVQLRDLGYIEGRNIRLEFRDAGGYADRLSALGREIVQGGSVEVIVAVSAPAALAAYRATQSIPIVAFVARDPIASGLAKSLAHPGGNVTGVAVFAEETTVKRVEFISRGCSAGGPTWDDRNESRSDAADSRIDSGGRQQAGLYGGDRQH